MLLLLKVKKHIVRHRLHMTPDDLESTSSSDPHIIKDRHNNLTHHGQSGDSLPRQEVLEEAPLTLDAHVEPVEDAITFEDIGQYLYGFWGRFAVDLCLLCSQVGFCVMYQIFLGDNIHGLLPSIPKIACMMMPVPILIVVCQIRRLKWLAATSFVALAVFSFGFAVCLYFSLARAEFGHVSLDMGPASAGGFATLVSFAVFSFEGIGLVLPLESSIRPEIRGSVFTKLFSATVSVVTVLYTVVGAFGYVAWGKDVGSSLLDNVVDTQGRSVWVILVIIGYLIGGFCSYPLNMYPVTVRLETMWRLADGNGNNLAHVKHVTVKRTILRTALVVLALILAIAIPSFGLIISLVGSLFSTALAFIFPTLFHMKLFSWPAHWPSGPLKLSSTSRLREFTSPPSSYWDYLAVIFDVTVCIFGIVATVICSIVSILNIVTAVKTGRIQWSFQPTPPRFPVGPTAPNPA